MSAAGKRHGSTRALCALPGRNTAGRSSGGWSSRSGSWRCVRDILDTAPIYSSVGVDSEHNEVFLQDTNTWSIRVFSRLDNAKPGDPPTEPRRVISGPKTDVQFNSCVWVDPASGDIYSVENDIGDMIVVFPNEATGDLEPKRKLKVTHRAFAMASRREPGAFPFGPVPASGGGVPQDGLRGR